MFPRLTANALLDAEKAAKTQLEDWLEKPQPHERLAVGDVACPYDTKPGISYNHSDDNPRRVIPAGASSSLVKEQSEMDDRLEKLQAQEWLAVGDVASSVRAEPKTIPEDNGEDLHRRLLAGLVDSTMNREGHRLGDRTDKPAKHELRASRGCGSHAPVKTDEFFADIHEILSGKTE